MGAGGEVPLAFVALTPAAAEKAKDPAKAQSIRLSILEVRSLCVLSSFELIMIPCSTSQVVRYITNI